jgi:hypothetical protein
MKLLILAALACALAPAGALATTYVADLSGRDVHVDNYGSFSGATLESITLASNIAPMDYAYLKGQSLQPYYYDPIDYILVGPEPGTSVTIANGELAGLALVDDYAYATFVLSGMSATSTTVCRFDLECQGVPASDELSGTLTARASTVPEPANAALLLAGTVLAAWALRRRQRAAREIAGA